MEKKEKKEKKNLFMKPPVVTVMGHVDHGKTTLLDYIRKTKVAQKEAGGITQRIGAYQIEVKEKKITFIDTPGHAAFAKMRAMGGLASDIVIVVIAADDGVMPQTLESINLAKQAKVPLLIVINKTDISSSDPNKVKKQLADNNVLVEGWGGDIVCVEVSAKTGKGINELLDVLLLMAEMLELKADPKADLLAAVIESKMDPKRGAVSTAVIQNGTMEVKEVLYSQDGQKCVVRALVDFKGNRVKKAVPGDAVEVLGFSKPVKLGSGISGKKENLKQLTDTANENFPPKEEGGLKKKQLNLIIKADTRGSLDAIESSLKAVLKEDVEINIIASLVGNVSEGDILLADTSRAVIMAFNVQVSRGVSDMAGDHKIIIRSYKIIYDLLKEVDGALEGIVELEEEKIKGRAEIIAKFKLPKSGDIISGCKVLAGRLKVKDKVEIWNSLEEMKEAKKSEEESEIKPLYTGVIKNLKIERDDVNVAGKDNEVGVFLNPPFPEVKKGYILEVL